MCMVTWLKVHKYSLTSVDMRQFLDLKNGSTCRSPRQHTLCNYFNDE